MLSFFQKKKYPSFKLSLPARVDIILKMAVTLIKLNQKDVIHNDISANNFLFLNDYTPVLIGFESALLGEEKTKFVLGQAEYQAPEVAKAINTVKSDIYSLGVLIIEILNGELFKKNPNTLVFHEIYLSEISSYFDQNLGKIIYKIRHKRSNLT